MTYSTTLHQKTWPLPHMYFNNWEWIRPTCSWMPFFVRLDICVSVPKPYFWIVVTTLPPWLPPTKTRSAKFECPHVLGSSPRTPFIRCRQSSASLPWNQSPARKRLRNKGATNKPLSITNTPYHSQLREKVCLDQAMNHKLRESRNVRSTVSSWLSVRQTKSPLHSGLTFLLLQKGI